MGGTEGGRQPTTDNPPHDPGALKPVLSPQNEATYSLWQQCRRHRALPRAGGIEQQDPWLMLCFDVLWELWEATDRADQAALAEQAPLLALLGGLTPKR